MQKRKGLAVLLAVLIVLLVSCTRQRNMDAAEFCRRFNELQEAETLVPDMFFKETAEASGTYDCNFTFAEGHTALLTLTAREDGTITALQLTCIPQGEAAYTAETFSALYTCFVRLVCVLAVCDTENDALDLVHTAGIAEDRLAFADSGYTGETDGFTYALFSGTQYLSLFCSRTR